MSTRYRKGEHFRVRSRGATPARLVSNDDMSLDEHRAGVERVFSDEREARERICRALGLDPQTADLSLVNWKGMFR